LSPPTIELYEWQPIYRVSYPLLSFAQYIQEISGGFCVITQSGASLLVLDHAACAARARSQ